MKDSILTFLKAISLIIVLFLPVYLITPSQEDFTDTGIVKVDPTQFKVEIGKEGGVLRKALGGDAKTFNPVMAQETSSTAVIGVLFNGLTKTNVKTLLPEPDLAERWERDETGTVWRFYLRKNVKWFDGKPVLADDVVFTYNDIYYNPEIPSSAKDILTVEGKKFIVKKIDDHTVEFVIPKPFAPFLHAVGQPILPKHALEKAVKEKKFTSTWSINTPPQQLIGTGAYKLKEYVVGQYALYERNPYYWEKDQKGQKVPYIPVIKALIIGDPDVRLIKFLSKEIDYYGVRPTDLPQLLKEKNRDFTIYNLGATPSILFVVFNQNPNAPIPKYKIKWFQNTKFRQAISYAVDRKGIINIAYNGLAYPIYTAITPANRRLFDEDYYPKYPFNLKKAKKLLLEAGFREGKDGYLYDKEGHKLQITLITNSGNKEREIIGNILKDDLRKIGIEVNFQAIDFNNLVSRLMSNYDWEAVIIGLTGSIDPYFGQNVWLSSGHLHMWYPNQKKPATKWEAEVDRLFQLAAVELDQKKRDMLYKKAFRIIGEQQPMVFITAPEELLAVRKRLKNVFPTVWGWYKSNYVYIQD
ncbi:MAG: ABC transporter substrate-binding protein [Aquificae bacterium]|nr:ABC transporter substrate-binding protein [Aquificota bacterium]